MIARRRQVDSEQRPDRANSIKDQLANSLLSFAGDDIEPRDSNTHLPAYYGEVLQRCKGAHLHRPLVTQLAECVRYVLLDVYDERWCTLHYAKIKHGKSEYYLHNRLSVEGERKREKSNVQLCAVYCRRGSLTDLSDSDAARGIGVAVSSIVEMSIASWFFSRVMMLSDSALFAFMACPLRDVLCSNTSETLIVIKLSSCEMIICHLRVARHSCEASPRFDKIASVNRSSIFSCTNKSVLIRIVIDATSFFFV